MLQIGDEVYIEDDAQVDVGFIAWHFIKDNRTAIVKAKMTSDEMGVTVPPGATYTPDYALEWNERYDGGHACHGKTANGCGQFVNEKHLSLNFENSREVVTIPNL